MQEKLPYSVAVFVRTRISAALVQDPEQNLPLYWKPPGGHGNPGETPLQAAVRETREETGLDISRNVLRYVGYEIRAWPRRHTYHLYEAHLQNLRGIKPKGGSGETVRIYPLNRLRTMPDLLPTAKKSLIKFRLI